MMYVTRSGLELEKNKGPRPGTFWLKQNENKSSEWAQLARNGHDVHHLMLDNKGKAGGFAGSIRIDNIIYGYEEARRIFVTK